MDPEKSVSDGRRRRRVVAALIVLVLAVVASFAVGRLSAPVTSNPGTTSAEAGFARDMQVHHAQAVEMSMIVRDETDNAEIRLLAYDIATTQAQQEGQMYGWLNTWHLPQANAEPAMTWMTRPALNGEASEHGHATSESDVTAGGVMPGYASAEQMAKLKTLSGVDAEKFFLELMIAHHEGGIEMADAILDRSTDDVIVSFANSIVVGQTAEITAMKELLAARS
jgi:uncharacterized protein (DUF305 family)